MRYIEEELTLAEFASKFLNVNEFDEPAEYDIRDLGIEVLTDDGGEFVYKQLNSFLIKEGVSQYYTDGNLKGTSNHRIIENGQEVFLKEHPDFELMDGDMSVVDIEVDESHTYLANGRLNHNTTPGGKGIPFHASVRIRLSSIGAIKAKVNGIDAVVGSRVKAKLVKNRCGPPLREAEYAVYFDSGIDDYSSWLEVMKDYNLVKQSGAWYEYTDKRTGEIIKFQSKDFVEKIISQPELAEIVYDDIAEKVIMVYQKSDEVRIDDVVVSDEPLLDEI